MTATPDGDASDRNADLDLGDSTETHAYFGSAYPVIRRFRDALASEGELRGLVGPREVDRLWSRHIFNSAAVVPFLPESGTIADVGSGAGLPGIVVATLRPAAHVVLIEPMERRCVWLRWIADDLGLTNVEVKRGRAEEFHGAFEVDAVTARAVAALDKLARMTIPLLGAGGHLVALKGRNAAQEVPAAMKALRRLGAGTPEVLTAHTIDAVDDTVVVRVVRETVRGA